MELRFLNRYQPPTLQNATILLYMNAVFSLLSGQVISLLLGIMAGIAGVGLAMDKKWGYYLAGAAAIIPLALTVLAITVGGLAINVFTVMSLMIEIALVVFVFHPTSRDYQRLWFK